MKRIPLLLCAIFLLGALGCDSSSDDDGVSLSQLEGQWSASSHIFTNNANASQGVDLIVLGGSTNMTVLSGGRARVWIQFGDYQDEFDAGLSISGSTLTVDPVEAGRDTERYKMVLAGNVLTLTNTQAMFDFTGTGAPDVSATQVIRFVRQ